MGKAIDKLLSGRYFATVMIVTTYCFVVAMCQVLTVKGTLSVEAFLGIFSGFSGLAYLIVKSYFEREDREKEKEKDNV